MAVIRTFFCIELPKSLKNKLEKLQNDLDAFALNNNVRWVKPDGIHLTLKFMGDTEETDVDKIIEKIKPIVQQTPTLNIKVEGLGAFPDYKKPKVLWVGVDKEETLVNLHDEIDKNLMEIGFRKDNKGYAPHLTLGRVKFLDHIEHVCDQMEETEFSAEFKAKQIVLMKSTLHRKGSIYEPLGTLTLKQD